MTGDLSLIFRNDRLSLARPIRTKTSSFTGTARNRRILRLLHADAETAKSGGNKRSVAMNSNPDSHFAAFSELYTSADLESASTFAGFCDVNLHFSKKQLSGTLRLGSRAMPRIEKDERWPTVKAHGFATRFEVQAAKTVRPDI